ncbi:hypothetical protein VB636_08920 [Paracoccus sp. APAP_BH8]|uniref:hypothetical protein n=1 Tax=Paracoccus sp. APAP_BH8 TaxID=3110237 RepID=UPI002FD8165C
MPSTESERRLKPDLAFQHRTGGTPATEVMAAQDLAQQGSLAMAQGIEDLLVLNPSSQMEGNHDQLRDQTPNDSTIQGSTEML